MTTLAAGNGWHSAIIYAAGIGYAAGEMLRRAGLQKCVYEILA